jgi:hypothetical protein
MGHGGAESIVNEARLREIYGGRLAARRPARRAGCPSLESLQALARRQGPEEERLRILDHAMSCADCRAELDLIRSIERAGRDLAATERPAGRRWLVPAALAASLLLAVGLGRLALAPPSEEDVVRSGSGAAAVALVSPAAGATAGKPLLFAWRPVPGATSYRLEVLSPSGEVAVEAETADTAVAPEAARRLAPGDYQWWVSALGAPGLPRSELRRLRLTK